MTKQEIKQALISLVVGASISFLTVLLQGLVGLLQQIPTAAPGSVAGMAYYLWKTRAMLG